METFETMSESTALVGSIQKFSVEDGPGIRTTVFLKGCPLNCRWCHNPEMIDPRQQLFHIRGNCINCGCCIEVCPQRAISADPSGGINVDRDKCNVCMECTKRCYAEALRPVAREMTVSEVMKAVLQDRSFYESTGGGMTISGGEILMHGEFVSRLVQAAKKENVCVCIDTCGFGDPRLLKSLAAAPNVSHVLFDIKAIDDEVHTQYTGVSNRSILDNLSMLAEDETTRGKIIARMPLINAVNDTEEMIRPAGELFRRLGLARLTLLPYHNLGIGKKRNIGGIQEEFKPEDYLALSNGKEFSSNPLGYGGQDRAYWESKVNWIRCIREGGTPICDVASHVQCAHLCHLSGIAARFGRTIQWDSLNEKIVGDEQAAAFFSREQRKGFEIPKVD